MEENIRTHQNFEIDFIPSGDISLYDNVLDHIVMFDAIPARFKEISIQNPEDLLFTMARGGIGDDGKKIPAMEITKWFNTNYHCIVPEIEDETRSSLNEEKLIINMDAEVISVEASQSKMDLLNGFQENAYPNEIGPGIYDIHSPNIPSIIEMVNLIQKALTVIPIENLWINPDCGLNARKWDEVSPALTNMVAAAKFVRDQNHK